MHIYEESGGGNIAPGHIRKREGLGAHEEKAGIRSHRGSGAPNSGLTTKEKLTQELEIPQAALRGVFPYGAFPVTGRQSLKAVRCCGI